MDFSIGFRGVAALVGTTLLVGAFASEDDMVGNPGERLEISTPVGSRGAKSAVDETQIRGKGWAIQGSLFYAQEQMSGTDFARIVSINQISGSTTGQKKSKWINSGVHSNFGGELTLVYRTGYDGWQLSADYLHFASDKSTYARADCNISHIIPTKKTDAITEPHFEFERATSARSYAYNSINIFGVQLQRGYFTSKTFGLDWGLGLEYIQTLETQSIRYCGPHSFGGNVDAHTVYVNERSSYKGVGPMISLESRWWLGSLWYIYGEGNIAAPYGSARAKIRQTYSLNDAFIEESDVQHLIKPNMRMQLGLGLATNIHDNKARLSAELGYDIHYFFNQHEVYNVDNFFEEAVYRDSHDISLRGLILNFKWEF